MKTSTVAIAAAALGLSVASAQAETVWTGAYIGLQGAWADGSKSGDLFYEDINVMGAGASEQEMDFEGGLGGFTLGYNYQFGNFVAGIEADGSIGSAEGEETFTMPGGAYKWQIETQLNMLATLRGRLGVAMGPVLLYGTGGLAYGQVSSDKEVTSNDGHPWQTTAIDSASDGHVGFVYGAGAEWMIAKGFSVKAEWLRVDLGKEDGEFEGTRYAIKPGTETFPYSSDSYSGDLEMDLLRLGLNVRF